MPRKSPATAQRAPDPRPARTRAALSDALAELIQEKPWSRIRVSDILERTGIGRSTFYAHFDNKYDLLTANIPTVVLPVSTSEEGVPPMISLFEHVEYMQPFLMPIMSQPVLGEITETFHRELVASWTEHLGRQNIDEEQIAFAAEFLASGFLAVTKKWMATRCARSAKETCGDYERYAAAIIAEARSAGKR